MKKIHKLVANTAAVFVLLTWAAFIAVRHADGDIILTSTLGWQSPHVRPVYYGLPRGENDFNQIRAKGYWFGGDILYEGVPSWVLIIPCPSWVRDIGGDWIGSSHGYSRWIPNLL